MRIPLSVRSRYDEQADSYARLGKLVDATITSVKPAGWHFIKRTKEIESYALKLETGRYENGVIDDFFACTLVVENRRSVDAAEELIRKHFHVHERRPKDPARTHKHSDAFPFDDLRLYASIPLSDQVRPTGLEDLRFEVQVKTFLEHAWGIATHDLIYKGDEVSWAKERIAYQVKAMLEHAELSIDQSEQLRQAGSIALENEETIRLSGIIRFLTQRWSEDRLPKDKTRLARTIDTLMFALRLDLPAVEKCLTTEEQKGGGSKTLHLSPYGTILNAVLLHHKDAVQAYSRKYKKRHRLFVSPEIEAFDSVYAAMKDVFQVLAGAKVE
ncbi:MAG: hypothetical protein M9900_09870 [Flavobacteriales bacterium]|nr:hypothetical protein [Flavobacteriales bacterium]